MMKVRGFVLTIHLIVVKYLAAASLDNGIFDWVRKGGGIYHEAQDFRREEFEVDGDSDSEKKLFAGVFAKKDIAKGTVLAKIPWKLVIPSDNLEESGQLCCGLVDRLKRELLLGNQSQFAPYIEYVSKLPINSIPAMWSDAGKKLIEELVGQDNMPPEDPLWWLVNEWFSDCGGSWEDTLGIQAALIVITRSDDHILIPGYDMYNHRNGNWTNARTISEEGIHHITVAARDIRKGEQIYISYNRCEGCDNRRYEYGTAEIFRDYGFVEPLPQRFYYTDGDRFMVQFDIVESDDNSGNLKIIWDRKFGIPSEKYSVRLFAGYLRNQIRRLRRVANISYRNGNPGMPNFEWDSAWEFQKANIRAMTLALEALGEAVDSPSNVTSTVTHYDPLGPEPDDLTYADETCDNNDELQHVDHFDVEFRQTRYQDLNFMIEPKTRDVVMELDAITQISSAYRPHYHEYSVHAAARFVDSVKRVIFIGGGDSMLLHEVLKYPDLELVVGLELDQMVTRKAFKHFSTQPHFDDPRVEWWFGDATKSLLLLPKDYWQSFDLVLVDLSETVMSLGVTSELDVFDALALLLKPEGVLVKNELYMETISKVFDHSVQICYISPVICDQVLTMGSNKVDFFHSPVKDHRIQTLLYEPMTTRENRHNFLHDFSRNDARAQGKCELREATQAERSKSAGIMEMVEAEKVSIALDETAISVLEHAVTMEGFHLSAETVFDKNLVMINMKEGYVMARFFPEAKYCNLDINLWGRFEKLKELSLAITKALGSELVSKYRVVVGGMFGSSTWEDDKELIGPQIVQARDCSIPEVSAEKPTVHETAMITAVLEQSLSSLMVGEGSFALVICGSNDVACFVHDTLSKSKMLAETVRLSTCAGLDPENSLSLYDCEIAIRTEWRQLLAHAKKLSVLAVDTSTPKEMLQIVNSILYDERFRRSSFADRHVFLTCSTQPEEGAWRQEFLDRYRKQHMGDPVSHAKYEIGLGPLILDVGIVSAGQKDVALLLDQAEENIQKQLPDASVKLQMIHGGKYAYWEPWEPRRFLQSDYDNSPGLAQYHEQNPLAVQAVVQFQGENNSADSATQQDIEDAFDDARRAAEVTCTTTLTVDEIGNGCVLACLNSGFGTIVLVWDGHDHMDINFYTTNVGKEVQEDMELFFVSFRKSMKFEVDAALRDDMPRGTGRVVNFKRDMKTPSQLERMFQSLLKRADAKAGKNTKKSLQRDLGSIPIVEEGSCSNTGADQSTCWPDLPPLQA